MLTYIDVPGVGRVPLTQITVLVGENGIGKSRVLRAIHASTGAMVWRPDSSGATRIVLARTQTNRDQVLLIENPEVGVHPRRLAELASDIQEVAAEGTQIILTTHSPLLLNEFHPDQIVVMGRRGGSDIVAARLSDCAAYQKVAAFCGPGEAWVNEGEDRLLGFDVAPA